MQVVQLFNRSKNRSSDEILRELEDAYLCQTSLLPEPFENARVKVETLFYPLKEISGDFYDVWWDVKTETLHGFLIDATGHSICSALQVFALRELFRCSIEIPGNLAAKMQWINSKMFSDVRHDPVYAAAIMFSLKPDGVLCYTAAGISPVYVYMHHRAAYVDMYGNYVGIVEDAKYVEACMHFNQGDAIIFMTDGFSDRLSETTMLTPNKTITAMHKIGQDPMRRDDAAAVIVKLK